MDPASLKVALQVAAAFGRHRGLRWTVVGVLLLALVTQGMVIYGPWLAATQFAASFRNQQQAVTDGGSCASAATTMKTIRSFSAAQVANARTIWRVGAGMSVGEQGATIGLATALQESTLRNLNYGDRDSVGLFQQRAGWGSRAERMNPVVAARKFYVALATVDGWRTMSLTEAAQAVQRSAFPMAYADWEHSAAGLVALFRSGARADSPEGFAALAGALCGNLGATSCPATGMAVEAGLSPDALRVLRCLKSKWPQLTSFAGVGERPGNARTDHRDGRAVDAMIPAWSTLTGRELGDEIAAWAVANRAKLGIRYVIWHTRIWNVERASDGWRTCGTPSASCYSGPDPSAAHRDHVHISVFGNRAGEAVDTGADLGSVVTPVDRHALTARFGQCSGLWRRCHTGLDFSAAYGASVRAVMAGTVTWTSWGGDYANLTKVRHANGLETWYAHQSSRTVRVGDGVRAGQVIGQVGQTGNTTGAHLHLEVRMAGAPVDPDRWLNNHGVRA